MGMSIASAARAPSRSASDTSVAMSAATYASVLAPSSATPTQPALQASTPSTRSSDTRPVYHPGPALAKGSSGELSHEGGIVAYGPVLDALAVDDADYVHLLVG